MSSRFLACALENDGMSCAAPRFTRPRLCDCGRFRAVQKEVGRPGEVGYTLKQFFYCF